MAKTLCNCDKRPNFSFGVKVQVGEFERCISFKPCYYDGSGLDAEDFFKVLVTEGEDALWAKMEVWYAQCFKNEPLTRG